MVVNAAALGLRVVDADNDRVLDLQLLQGLWTQAQYLTLTDYSRRMLEFTDGYIEVLPMPTDRHQVISQFLRTSDSLKKIDIRFAADKSHLKVAYL